MTTTVSRRTALRVGLAATGVGLSVGTALVTRPVAQTVSDPLTQVLQDQIKEAIGKMHLGYGSEGFQQAATTLRIAAATFDDAALTAAVRRANTQTILQTEPNYHEIERVARIVGVDLAMLKRHGNRQVRQEVLTQLRKTGFVHHLRHSATLLDNAARAIRLSNRVMLVARQDQDHCGDCQRICALVGPSLEVATVACAVMIAWPPAAAACSAATLAFLTFTVACAACEAYIMWCMDNGGK